MTMFLSSRRIFYKPFITIDNYSRNLVHPRESWLTIAWKGFFQTKIAEKNISRFWLELVYRLKQDANNDIQIQTLPQNWNNCNVIWLDHSLYSLGPWPLWPTYWVNSSSSYLSFIHFLENLLNQFLTMKYQMHILIKVRKAFAIKYMTLFNYKLST